MIKEDIVLGDLVVKKQIIGVADEIDIPLLDDVVWDGILGLAYPNSNLKKQSIRPLFDNIMDQNLLIEKSEKNQFAYFLGKETGAITFGGADMRYKEDRKEEFKWAPIKEENYWTISLKDVRKEYPKKAQRVVSSRFLQLNSHSKIHSKNKNMVKKLCQDGCKTIVDTGTYLVYGPQEIFQNYLSDIMIDSCNNKDTLPDIIFEFQGENGTTFDLRMKPDDYVLHFKVDGVDDCVIGIAPDTEDSGWTFGQVFLRAFYTIFDRDENRIGFVRSNTGVYPQPGMEKKKENNGKSESQKDAKSCTEPAKSFIGVIADSNVQPASEAFNTPKIERSIPDKKIEPIAEKSKEEKETIVHSDIDDIPDILGDADLGEAIFGNNENNDVNERYLNSQIKYPLKDDSLLRSSDNSIFNSESLSSDIISGRRRRRRRRLRRR